RFQRPIQLGRRIQREARLWASQAQNAGPETPGLARELLLSKHDWDPCDNPTCSKTGARDHAALKEGIAVDAQAGDQQPSHDLSPEQRTQSPKYIHYASPHNLLGAIKHLDRIQSDAATPGSILDSLTKTVTQGSGLLVALIHLHGQAQLLKRHPTVPYTGSEQEPLLP
ncbi:hypothetical protein LTR33_018504, partial [Friedmanniomyces endolithicus]